MLAFALDLAMGVYHAAGFDVVFPHLIGIDFPLAFLYGPLLFLYARALSQGDRSLGSVDLLHLAPFGLLVLVLIPFFLQSGSEKLAIASTQPVSLWTHLLGVINHLKLVHAFVYVAAIFVLLKNHRSRIRNTFSSIERINLRWMRNLMIGIVGLTSVAIVLYIRSLGRPAPVVGLDPSAAYDDVMLLGLALLVYSIGFMGLRQPEIFDRRHHLAVASGMAPPAAVGAARRASRGAGTSPDPAVDEPGVRSTDLRTPANTRPVRLLSLPTGEKTAEANPPNTAYIDAAPVTSQTVEKDRYSRSGMDATAAERYEEALVELMHTEKLYQRGDLKLQDLADAMGISPHNLTEVINTRIGRNFYDFVNGYRVDEVKSRLSDPNYAHLTILAIALDSGFNSKSSFNSIFKKHAGMTPSRFRSQEIARCSSDSAGRESDGRHSETFE